MLCLTRSTATTSYASTVTPTHPTHIHHALQVPHNLQPGGAQRRAAVGAAPPAARDRAAAGGAGRRRRRGGALGCPGGAGGGRRARGMQQCGDERASWATGARPGGGGGRSRCGCSKHKQCLRPCTHIGSSQNSGASTHSGMLCSVFRWPWSSMCPPECFVCPGLPEAMPALALNASMPRLRRPASSLCPSLLCCAALCVLRSLPEPAGGGGPSEEGCDQQLWYYGCLGPRCEFERGG